MTACRPPTDRGMMVVVVGPSGAGKDSLLASARQAFVDRPDIVFVRRVITRTAGDASEPFTSVEASTFERLRQQGAFVVHWQAHHLHYGVPKACVDDLHHHRVVIVNGSRAALPRFAEIFPRRHIVHVTAPAPLLEQRLRGRGREHGPALTARLERQVDLTSLHGPVWTLDNSGSLESSSARFVDWLTALSDDVRCRE